MINQAWQENYKRGRFNRYPYDSIVTFIMRNFAKSDEPSKIKILDLGCGGGNNLRFLQELGFDFRAIDGAPESVKLSKEYLSLDDDDVRIVEGDFCELPFDDNMFDAVIDRASLSCNKYDDVCRIVNEIHRVLKPGGMYFGTDLYDREHPDLEYGHEMENGDYSDFTSGNFFFARQMHAFNPEQLRKIFCAFKKIEMKKIQHDNIGEKEVTKLNIFYELTAMKNHS